LDEIMVSDNGCGMPFEELPLAVKRFTTSKIGSVEDLDSIATLGFRVKLWQVLLMWLI